MSFEYKAYKKIWYHFGLSEVIFFTLIIAFLLFAYMFGNRANVHGDYALICLILFSLFAVFALKQTFPLRCGFPLMFEKQSELVLFSGMIESISERSLRTLTIEKRFRSYGVTNYHGSFVTISGQEFFFFNAKYLSVGDEIRVSYLPKSRIVLEYKRLDAQKAVNRNDKIYAIRADVMNRSPDVEVIFEFNGTRIRPAIDGYRPAHLVTDDHLTTGIHHYYEVESVPPDGTAKGTITFLSPEAYPHCLWIGKKINIQEGARIVGYATITEIYNPLLRSEN